MDSSSAAANNTPSVVNNNVREMGFVPTFLSHSKGRSGGTLDVPENGADDDCDDYISNNSPKREGALPSSYNMITEHHRQQQQQQQQHKSHRNAKLGPLVQRMHALRYSNQRMAMRLRSGQLVVTPPGGGSSGSSFLASRKRRRSGGGEYLDPTSMLDVTVSCASLSFDTTIANCGILLAYIHARTEIKGSSSSLGQFMGRLNLPCYARLIMSRDVIHERGIVNDCINKQLRLYDALVIPARLMMTGNLKERGGSSSDDVDCYHNNMMKNMLTTICATICQDYPTDKPTLQDVSFQLHNP
jgi:hypothetical protein